MNPPPSVDPSRWERRLARFLAARGRRRRRGDPPRPRAAGRPRVLWVFPYAIHPMIHGGAVRAGNLLPRLAEHVDVFLVLFSEGSDEPEQRRTLGPLCEQVFVQQTVPVAARSGAVPAAARAFTSPDVARRLRSLVDAHEIDLVQLDYTELGHYARPDRLGTPVVLTEIDLTFVTRRRRASVPDALAFREDRRSRLAEVRLLADELRACEAADQVHVMSGTDRDILAPLLTDGSRRLRIVPNGVDLDAFHPGLPSQEVLFLGSFPHRPNLDGLLWFLDEVWPLVRARRPQSRITVAGSRPPAEVLDRHGKEGVTVLGEVAESAPLYRDHRVLVAPLRAGSGTRLKVLEAFASGLPVVSTAIGVEGIEGAEGSGALLAETPAAFADAVSVLLESPEIPAELGRRARKLAERYGWDEIAGTLVDLYRDLAAIDRLDAGPSRHADEKATRPDISVVVVHGGGELLEEALRTNEGDRTWEIVPAGSPAGWPESRSPTGAAATASWGSLANRGARAARGGILVFVDGVDRPQGRAWLDRLVAPLDASRPPAAVLGRVHPVWDIRAPATARGLVSGPRIVAVRRDVWSAFPFDPDRPGPRAWASRLRRSAGPVVTSAVAVKRSVAPTSPGPLFELATAFARRASRLLAKR